MSRLHDDAARAAFESNRLVPPPRAASFTDGATAELRDAMARFSSGDQHRHRRAAIEAAIADVDTALLVREVIERTEAAAELTGSVDAVTDVGLVVPTSALLATPGVPAQELMGRSARRGRDRPRCHRRSQHRSCDAKVDHDARGRGWEGDGLAARQLIRVAWSRSSCKISGVISLRRPAASAAAHVPTGHSSNDPAEK